MNFNIAIKHLVILVGLAAVFAVPIFLLSGTDTSGLAKDVVQECSGRDSDASACYEDALSALYPTISLTDIFDIIRKVRVDDPAYQFCHVLAHKLGERVVAEDPDAWLDAIALNPPDGMCSNGFIHGVIGGRFRAEVLDDATLETLLPDFKKACEPRENWRATELDRAICYHGMGHLFVFITDADIPKALGLCEQSAPFDVRRVCVEGVFMQIYQPLEPDDFELLKRLPSIPDAETYRAFCAAFGRSDYAGACLREAWPLYREEILAGSGAVRFCSGQPSSVEENNCYVTVSAIIGRMSLGGDDSSAACRAFPSSRQLGCFESVARAVLEEDRTAAPGAVAVCEMAGDPIARQCLERLMLTRAFMFGDDARLNRAFCAAFPADMRERCSL